MVPLERGIDNTDLPSPTAEGITLYQNLAAKPLEASRFFFFGGGGPSLSVLVLKIKTVDFPWKGGTPEKLHWKEDPYRFSL